MARAFTPFTLAVLACAGCVSPAVPTPPPTPLVFEATLTVDAPTFSATVGPAPAGDWRADLAYENLRQLPHTVSLIVRDASGEIVAHGEARTLTLLTARWRGGAQATYRIDVVGVDVPDPLGEIITLQVLEPGP